MTGNVIVVTYVYCVTCNLMNDIIDDVVKDQMMTSVTMTMMPVMKY